MTAKEMLLQEIQTTLSNIDDFNLFNVSGAIAMCLKNYDVINSTTSLTLYDNEDERLIKRFIATKRLEGNSESTLKRYYDIITKLLKDTELHIKEIDVYVLRLYLAQRSESWKDTTLEGIRCIFSSFFGWLYKEKLISTNPCATLRSIKTIKEVKEPFSNIDIDKMRSACSNSRDRAIIEFLLSTGCRISEVVNLNIKDIDLQNRQVKVFGKGKKERIVYFDEIACLWLTNYLKERHDSYEALFVGRGSQRLSISGVQSMLNKIATEANVSNVHPHRFRHTMATNMISRGASIQDVAGLLGHSNINTTMVYVTIQQSHLKEVHNKYSA